MRHGTRLWNGWTTRGLQPKTNSDMFFFNLLMHFGLQLGILLSLALLVAAREREHEEVTREPCVFVDNGPMTTTLELSAGTPPKKLQQKARRQAKQKKSKSAEFLMARVDAAGTENPAFDAEPCLLPVWPAREIQGNESAPNDFDPISAEQTNPRRGGVAGVRRRDELELSMPSAVVVVRLGPLTGGERDHHWRGSPRTM
ncbi:uncharacterized protein LOC127592937 isoform X2 [Hippocampus zosterae]|uniref:uncharacterized protein LOC127592937 isoform X2 n=1 Tax=Hippocampus zosterae TaxID=109293 RepID=UPI00223E2058|nr:uncharacterized protein LOC127592937 isoform X2 [Hippocampus zosterae]